MESIQFINEWSLDHLKEAPAEPLGRASYSERLTRAVTRKLDPTVLVVAEAGAGKTALVQSWARAALEGRIGALGGWSFAALDVPALLEALARGTIGTAALMDTL